MSNPLQLKGARRVVIAFVACFAFAAITAAAQASPVSLGTAKPFVVLGGQSVTNTGASVLNGSLGVAPGTSLTGFGPALVTGATHNNDGVANQAQSDLTTAYNTAAAQPINTGGDLSTQDLGGKTLLPGAYTYSSAAQLTGTVTFNAQGDPNAQFVVKVGSQLTTASASRVALAGGANPCNIYWKVDTAVLGTTTAFQGNILALTSISLNNGVSVMGRALARNGSVTLNNDLLNGSSCGTGSTSSSGPSTAGSTSSGGGSTTGAVVTHNGRAIIRRTSHRRHTRHGTCTAGFRARVSGRLIKRVVFSLDGHRISHRSKSPFSVYVKAAAGVRHKVSARITFKDATRAKTMSLRYRACAAAALRPRRGPSKFTG